MKEIRTQYCFHITKDAETGEYVACLMKTLTPDLETAIVGTLAVTFGAHPRGEEQAKVFEGALGVGGDVINEVMDRIFALGIQAGMSFRNGEGT